MLANQQRMARILKDLEVLMVLDEDDLRTYPIHSAETIWMFGQANQSSLMIPYHKTAELTGWQRTQQWLDTKYPTQSAPKEAD